MKNGQPLLLQLPGIGPSLARKITQAFGSEEAFQAACQDLQLAPLLAIEGLSERRAFQIVHEVRSAGVPPLPATDRARDIQRELEELIESYANTTHGKRYLRLLPTLRDAEEIEASAKRVLEWRRRVEALDRPAVARQLQRLGPLREPGRLPSTRRVLLVDDEESEMEARSRGLDRWLRIGTMSALASDLPDDALVLDATSEGIDDAGTEAPVVRARVSDPLWKLVPGSSLEFLRLNRGCIEALAELARLTGGASRAGEILDAPADAAIDGTKIREAAARALAAAQAELEKRLGSFSLSGLQVLELLAHGSSKLLDEASDAAAQAGRAVMKAEIGLLLDPFEPQLPLRLDEELLADAERKAQSRATELAFRSNQEAARKVEAARPALGAELERWFSFDVEFALGRLAADFDLRPASSSKRVKFVNAVNLRLRREGPVQPVSYEVGHDNPVAVLTGANSGGKTSVLELVAQLVILHHWGLPVPAEAAEIPILQELHCVAPVRGGDAGAFESFLRDLFPPLVRPGAKLLLLDEVENVTELEAAGRILGVFIDEVARTGSLAVVVTHLPSEVLAHVKTKVRVDGIDAVGLDEKFNLIVDRQPKLNHWARSTPELILRRVHSKAQGDARELYARILQLWQKGPPKAQRPGP
ncbi:MAG: hypothetical protein HYT80_02000 [Euryarchaeota archaeon]|nr:hypothetical protein [Euryarchaeota archaeon]